MKLDKEMIIKHRFWALLIGVLPLILVAVFILTGAIPATIADYRTKIMGAKKKGEGPFQEPKNEHYQKVMKETADELDARMNDVWKRVYDPQEPITLGEKAWPPTFNQIFRFHDGLFARRVQVFSAARTPELPTDGRLYFVGVVKEDVNKEFIVVEGTGTEFKELCTKKFHRTGDLKVTRDGKVSELFSEISRGDNVQVAYQVAKYFNDPLTNTERANYDRYYKEQIPPILEQVEPLQSEKEGVVQFNGWSFKKGELPPATNGFLKYVSAKWDDSIDFSMHAWIAQEDLWIQREMYRLVRLSNDYVSKFVHISGDGKNSPYICINPYWRLELKLVGDDLQVKATNETTRRQNLDVSFWLNFTEKDAETKAKTSTAAEWAEYRRKNFEKVLLGGEPINPKRPDNPNPDNFRVTRIELPPGLPRDQIFSVEQVLNWRTAAVKRIDVVEIGAHSHRTTVKGVRPLKEEKTPVLDPANPNPIVLNQPKAQNPYGLKVERYSEVTPQSRRLPVAISLIVDQQHTNRVMSAFANSDLRLVMTQVLQNHYPSVRPAFVDQVTVKGPIGFQPNAGQNQPTEEQEANVELVIYGIVTIYERYPPRPPDPDGAQVQTAEGTPGAQPMMP